MKLRPEDHATWRPGLALEVQMQDERLETAALECMRASLEFLPDAGEDGIDTSHTNSSDSI